MDMTTRRLALARENDAASLIESRMVQVRSAVDALQRALRSHQDDLGDDAKHWTRDLDDQSEHYLGHLTMAECETCGRLAVWLRPDTFERYCEAHRDAFLCVPA